MNEAEQVYCYTCLIMLPVFSALLSVLGSNYQAYCSSGHDSICHVRAVKE